MLLYLCLYAGRQCVHIHVYVHIKVRLCAYSILCLCCGQHLSLRSAAVFFCGGQSVDSFVSTLDLPGRCWQVPFSLFCLTSPLRTIRRSVFVSVCVLIFFFSNLSTISVCFVPHLLSPLIFGWTFGSLVTSALLKGAAVSIKVHEAF